MEYRIKPNRNEDGQFIIMFEVSSRLIPSHFDIFKEKFEDNKALFKTTGVYFNQVEDDIETGLPTVAIHVPISDEDMEKLAQAAKELQEVSLSGEGSAQILSPIPESDLGVISTIFGKSITESINKEMLTNEVIPLRGYPLEKLKEEVSAAVKSKRGLMLFRSFEDYKEMASSFCTSKNGIASGEFYHVPYMSEEYADAVIAIMEGSMTKLRKEYTPKLVKQALA